MEIGPILQRELIVLGRRKAAYTDRLISLAMVAAVILGCLWVWDGRGWDRASIAVGLAFALTTFGLVILAQASVMFRRGRRPAHPDVFVVAYNGTFSWDRRRPACFEWNGMEEQAGRLRSQGMKSKRNILLCVMNSIIYFVCASLVWKSSRNGAAD